MVAFPSGQMGGGLPPSGGAFGPSAGKQSGVNWGSINQFLEGPFQDLTEGLASVITKDNAYRTYINEKRSARKRQRLTDILSVPEMYANLAQKNPQAFAKLYGPGGAFDGEIQTTRALVQEQLVNSGMDPALADHYFNVVDAMTRIPPEATELPDKVQVLQYAQQQGIQPGSPEWIGLGLGEQDAQMRKSIGTYPGADGQEMVIIMEPDGTITSEPAGPRAAQQPLVSQVFGTDGDGNFVTVGGQMGGGGSGGTGAVAGAGSGGPAGGAGFIPVGKRSDSDAVNINQRVAEMDTGVKVVDSMLGIAGQPGPQLGRAGGIVGWAKEFVRVGRDLGSISPAMREQIGSLTKLADGMIQRDLSADGIDPELASSLIMGDPTVDAKAAENRLAYMYARLLQGDGKILKDAVESARSSVSLLKGSEQTVVQNLLNLRRAFTTSRQALQKSSGLTVKPEQEKPNLGEYEKEKPAAAAPTGELPRVANDADYEALPSGAEFIDPNGKRRRKP
jgi:hypothetical protein